MNLYVATDGSDVAAGTEGAPFATLKRAADEIITIKAGGMPSGGITVNLRGGYYPQTETLALTSAHNGTAADPVVWRSYTGEEAIVTGDQVVTGWALVTDSGELARLGTGASGNVYACDVSSITDYGVVDDSYKTKPAGWPITSGGDRLEFHFNSEVMTLARWPNSGYDGVMVTVPDPTIGLFTYADNRIDAWAGEAEAWTYGHWENDWSSSYQQVKAITGGTNTLEHELPYFQINVQAINYKPGQNFMGVNLMIELDSAGEWYLDRTAERLYFWPPSDVTAGRAALAMIETAISLTNTEYITLADLAIEATRGDGIKSSNGTSNTIDGCKIRNTGGTGITHDGGTAGGSGHRFINNEFYGQGDGCIRLIAGTRATLTEAGHLVRNNHFHDFARWNTVYNPAVFMGWETSGREESVGNRVSNNHIHDAPHMAIYFSGNNHTIEYNDIHDVTFESNDAGAIYAGSDWSYQGTTIRYNYLHSINGLYGNGASGVYLDDMMGGAQVLGNTFYDVSRSSIMGGGRYNNYEGNVFVDSAYGVVADDRGLGWASGSVPYWTYYLELMPYQTPPWSDQYPWLVNCLTDEPGAPKYDIITKTISWKNSLFLWHSSTDPKNDEDAFVVRENNLENTDPLFVDEDNQNFELAYNSPAIALGAPPIPYHQIGVSASDIEYPSPVSGFSVQPNAGYATLSWQIPTTRVDGSALPVGEIDGYVVDYVLDGGVAQQAEVLGGSTTTRTIYGLSAGDWYFRVTARDVTPLLSGATNWTKVTVTMSEISNLLTDSFNTLDPADFPVQTQPYGSYTLYVDVAMAPVDAGDPYWSSNSGPMTYAMTAIPGLTFSSAGILSGTPTAIGEYPRTISATNQLGTTASAEQANISVVAAPVVVPSEGTGLDLGLKLLI